jgi:hypothetical protein
MAGTVPVACHVPIPVKHWAKGDALRKITLGRGNQRALCFSGQQDDVVRIIRHREDKER